MKIRSDDLNDTINAPVRPTPGALPVISKKSELLRKKHKALVEELHRATDRRDLWLDRLMRAENRVRDARKALARSTLRLKAQQMLESIPNAAPDDPIYRRVQ